jgi:hypothetical protein
MIFFEINNIHHSLYEMSNGVENKTQFTVIRPLILKTLLVLPNKFTNLCFFKFYIFYNNLQILSKMYIESIRLYSFQCD